MSEEKTITIEVTKDFKFAHRGCDVVAYQAGTTVEVTPRCAEIALTEKWAKATKAKKAAPENKAILAAPENKAATEEAPPAGQPVADQSDTPNE
ncbi:MAG: hypothetical protein PHV02_08660 [Rhodocyclaceae bacterium]|nr:hypothetical protein [Rhodocyclaceae bacterium]